MKRYALFYGNSSNSLGGWEDFIGSFESIKEAQDSFDYDEEKRNWAQVVDLHIGKVICYVYLCNRWDFIKELVWINVQDAIPVKEKEYLVLIDYDEDRIKKPVIFRIRWRRGEWYGNISKDQLEKISHWCEI